ncbi:DUF3221 domain-containing protein [Bacillaceae bacterium S4-13-58]
MKKQFKSVVFLFICSIFLVSCSNLEQNDNKDLSEFGGYVVLKRIFNSSYQILVVPKIEKDTIMSSTDEELKKISMQKNGVYFSVEEDLYNKIQKGSRVKVIYDLEKGQEDSSPPQRDSENVQIVD